MLTLIDNSSERVKKQVIIHVFTYSVRICWLQRMMVECRHCAHTHCLCQPPPAPQQTKPLIYDYLHFSLTLTVITTQLKLDSACD